MDKAKFLTIAAELFQCSETFIAEDVETYHSSTRFSIDYGSCVLEYNWTSMEYRVIGMYSRDFYVTKRQEALRPALEAIASNNFLL